MLGNPMHLVCKVTTNLTDDPLRSVFWYKDGRRLGTSPRSDRLIVTKVNRSSVVSLLVSVLDIRRSTVSDSGHYFCRSFDNRFDQITVTVLTGKARVMTLDISLLCVLSQMRLSVARVVKGSHSFICHPCTNVMTHICLCLAS